MRCERFELAADRAGAAALATALRELVPAPESVADQVAEILSEVRWHGDEALSGYTRRFDSEHARALIAGAQELESAADTLAPALRAGIEQAIANVERVALAGVSDDTKVSFEDGHEVVLRRAPVDTAAVYVPGGRAPYPSTVVMGAVTARAAGVGRIVLCSPPRGDGEVDPVVLAAARLCGVRTVYRMGGAQAIAALAYGTESVEPVEVIVGPGNLYVQEAKRQVSGQVGIDGFAGPSDLMLIADGTADIEPLVLDLLAQAEHGPGTLVVAVSSSEELLGDLRGRLEPAPDTGAVAALVHASDGLALAQAFAPEHLQLVGPEAEGLAPRITRAGCLFVGSASGTAFGDYIAGSNHVLPTNGAARFASALNPAHFRRSFTEVRINGAGGALAQAAAPLARAEGFELHARSMEARIRDNGRR